MTPYVLTGLKPFCICAALTGYMLIITNGSKKLCCCNTLGGYHKAATGDGDAAAGFSPATLSMSLSPFLVTFFFFIPHNFIFSYVSPSLSHILSFSFPLSPCSLYCSQVNMVLSAWGECFKRCYCTLSTMHLPNGNSDVLQFTKMCTYVYARPRVAAAFEMNTC